MTTPLARNADLSSTWSPSYTRKPSNNRRTTLGVSRNDTDNPLFESKTDDNLPQSTPAPLSPLNGTKSMIEKRDRRASTPANGGEVDKINHDLVKMRIQLRRRYQLAHLDTLVTRFETIAKQKQELASEIDALVSKKLDFKREKAALWEQENGMCLEIAGTMKQFLSDFSDEKIEACITQTTQNPSLWVSMEKSMLIASTLSPNFKDQNAELKRYREHLKNLKDQVSKAEAEVKKQKDRIAEAKVLKTEIDKFASAVAGNKATPHDLLQLFQADLIASITDNDHILHVAVSGNREQKDTPDLRFNTDGQDGSSEDSVPSSSSKLPNVKAGSTNRLMERLAYDAYNDINFQRAFLLTYRSFMSPNELIEKLSIRYCATPKPGNTAFQGNAGVQLYSTTQRVVQLRVLTVIKYWVDQHWHDFDQELMEELFYFLDHLSVNQALAIAIKKILTKRLAGIGPLLQRRSSGPDKATETVAKNVPEASFLDMDPEEVAKQLTLIEFELYSVIQPKEFFGLGWSKKDKETKSPNLIKMIKRFNKVSLWVCGELVLTSDFMQRVTKLKKMITIAYICYHTLHNFNGCLEIISGLENSAVHRLRKTWGEVRKDEALMEKYEDMKGLMLANYARFRRELRSVEPPCIPYIGVFLTDLTFMEDANPDRVDSLINFNKLRQVGEKIQEIIQYQNDAYRFERNYAIADYLANVKEFNEDEIYEMSLRIETKKMQKFFG